ncbi:MAG: hypothetical protein WD042_00960 [Phycisphaeraceae bacterium]
MLKLHPEILKKNGQNQFVVLPYEEFVQLHEVLDDALDVLELRRAKLEERDVPTIGLEELKTKLDLEDGGCAKNG